MEVFHLVGGTVKDIAYWKTIIKEENVIFHGFLSYPEAEQYRQTCDILLAPYQHEVAAYGGDNIAKWMSPLKIFEYMAAGKAIICSDLPVLREVLQHEKNALLCKADDVDEWVAALKRLQDDKMLRESLGIQARKSFMEKYEWKTRARNLLSYKI